ncbi:MAG: hypothetical protein WD077_12720 [Bacteroidia bacterium]
MILYSDESGLSNDEIDIINTINSEVLRLLSFYEWKEDIRKSLPDLYQEAKQRLIATLFIKLDEDQQTGYILGSHGTFLERTKEIATGNELSQKFMDGLITQDELLNIGFSFHPYSENIYTTLVDWKKWEGLAKKHLNSFNISIKEENNIYEKILTIFDRRNAYLNVNREQLVSKKLQIFMSTLVDLLSEFNYVGSHNTIPYKDIYSTALQAVEGALTFEEQITKLSSHGAFNPKMEILAQALLNAPVELKADFFTTMRVGYSEFIAGIERTETKFHDQVISQIVHVSYFPANMNSSSNLLMKAWKATYSLKTMNYTSEDFQSLANDLESLYNDMHINGRNPLTEKHIEKFSLFLLKIGIDIPPEEAMKYFEKGDVIKNYRTAGKHLFAYYTISSSFNGGLAFSGIIRAVRNQEKLFTTERNNLTKYTDIKRKFITHSTSYFLGGDSKLVYPYNALTYIDELFEQYQRGIIPFNLESDPLYYQKSDGKYSINHRYSDFIIRAVKEDPSFRENFKPVYFDVLKIQSESTEKVNYQTMSAKMSMYNRYNAFLKGGSRNDTWIALPTFVGFPTMMFIKVRRINPSGRHNYPLSAKEMLLSFVYQDIMKAKAAQEAFRIAVNSGRYYHLIYPYHICCKSMAEMIRKTFKEDGPIIQEFEDLTITQRQEVLTKFKGRAFEFLQLDFLEHSDSAKELMRLMLESSDEDKTWAENDELVGQAYKDIQAFINNEIESEKMALTSYGIHTQGDYGISNPLDTKGMRLYTYKEGKNTLKNNFNLLVEAFVYNNLIYKVELIKLTGISLGFSKSIFSFYESYAGLLTPGLKAYSATKEFDYGDSEDYNMAIVNDIFSKNTIKLFLEVLQNMDSVGRTAIQADRIMAFFTGEKEDNAIAITSLDKHRRKMMGLAGAWTTKHEEAYNNYVNFGHFRSDSGHIPCIPPLYTYHDGFYEDPSGGFVKRIVLQHLSFPLFTDLTKDIPVLDKVRRRMELKGEFKSGEEESQKGNLEKIDVVTTGSAIKQGLQDAFYLFDKNTKMNDLNDLKITQLKTSNEKVFKLPLGQFRETTGTDSFVDGDMDRRIKKAEAAIYGLSINSMAIDRILEARKQ